MFVDEMEASGKRTFVRDVALEALGISDNALRKAAARLIAQGRLYRPRRGFYVIVPEKYRKNGAPPPWWFIDDLMAHQGLVYYVGLLTAAALHGVKIERETMFQVLTSEPMRPPVSPKTGLRFFTKRNIADAPAMIFRMPQGAMRVATPESTALDLIRYSEIIGRLPRVAQVIAKLVPRIDPQRMPGLLKGEVEVSNIRRLGYILEKVGGKAAAEPLYEWLSGKRHRPVPLRTDGDIQDAPRDDRWQVLVNETIQL
jgi:hypothetical protein